MNVVNCRRCGRLFNYVAGKYICPACKEALEDRLGRALAMKGNLVFVSGASKSGKTVLCHKVIPQDKMVSQSGVQITSKEDFWQHVDVIEELRKEFCL